ncbi:MAG: hypothetical protein ACOCXJ_09185 [Planctomycetota bacterium]
MYPAVTAPPEPKETPMLKSIPLTLCAAFVLTALVGLQAAEGGNKVMATVQAVDVEAMTVTVQPDGEGAEALVLTTTEDTVIKSGKDAVALGDLAMGTPVRIILSADEPPVVQRIHVVKAKGEGDMKKKGKKKADDMAEESDEGADAEEMDDAME